MEKYLEQHLQWEDTSSDPGLYNGKDDWLDWHSDNEQLFHESSGVPILSLSLGATRLFQFKNKATHQISDVTLNDGTLVFMGGALQNGCCYFYRLQ